MVCEETRLRHCVQSFTLFLSKANEAKLTCISFSIFNLIYSFTKLKKLNSSKYRDASLKIFEIISKHCESVEKASIDEAYLDLTDEVMQRLSRLQTIQPNELSSSFVVGSYSIENSQGNCKDSFRKKWFQF